MNKIVALHLPSMRKDAVKKKEDKLLDERDDLKQFHLFTW